MGGDKVKSISDSTFETEIMQSEEPALVDFWAPWCGPCKAISPMLDELAGEFDGKVKMTKMNVDDNPATPGKFGIRAIPTLILFKNGQIVDQITGAVGKSQMVTMLNKAL
jgi:thioredoxin 1